MEIHVTLRDVETEDGMACELISTGNGDMPEECSLAEVPSVALMLVIRELFQTGLYLQMAASILERERNNRLGL